MTKIFRVQDKEGRGPYNPRIKGHVSNALLSAHCYDPERPSPWEDMPSYRSSAQHRFGFLLREDAFRWFEGFWEDLEKEGFQLVAVDGEVVHFGTSQVAFIPTEGEANGNQDG